MAYGCSETNDPRVKENGDCGYGEAVAKPRNSSKVSGRIAWTRELRRCRRAVWVAEGALQLVGVKRA